MIYGRHCLFFAALCSVYLPRARRFAFACLLTACWASACCQLRGSLSFARPLPSSRILAAWSLSACSLPARLRLAFCLSFASFLSVACRCRRLLSFRYVSSCSCFLPARCQLASCLLLAFCSLSGSVCSLFVVAVVWLLSACCFLFLPRRTVAFAVSVPRRANFVSFI